MNIRLHPLAELYRKAREVYEKASKEIERVEVRLRVVEEELARLTGELIRRYGPGYVTVKTVRNRQGKRYHYPVWRTPSGRDIYLRGEEAEEILRLREERRKLRIQYSMYRRLVWAAKMYMRQAEDYKDLCIDEDGEYVPCPQHG